MPGNGRTAFLCADFSDRGMGGLETRNFLY